MANSGSTYWCYRCERFIASRSRHIAICPDYGSGFVEELDDTHSTPVHISPRHLLRPYLSPLSISIGSGVSVNPRFYHTAYLGATVRRSHRRGAHDQPSSFNPIIVLRSPGENDNGGYSVGNGGEGESWKKRRNYQLYYDDGVGLGLHPLPVSISEFHSANYDGTAKVWNPKQMVSLLVPNIPSCFGGEQLLQQIRSSPWNKPWCRDERKWKSSNLML